MLNDINLMPMTAVNALHCNMLNMLVVCLFVGGGQFDQRVIFPCEIVLFLYF